jgi:putative oxidoreductase
MAIALLVFRLVLGVGMAVHGAQKLLGWFGGGGLAQTGGMFEALGFRPGRFFAFLAAAGEVGSGLLIALGLLGPVGPALLITVMIVAIFAVHWSNGFLASNQGYELPLLYAVAALALAFSGPGAYSLDAWIAPAWRWTVGSTWIALLCGAVLGGASLLARRVPAPAPAPQAR